MNPAPPADLEDSAFLDKRQLAARLNMTVRTIENWQKRGILPYIRIGKVVRFHWPEVVQQLKANYRYNRRVCLPEVSYGPARRRPVIPNDPAPLENQPIEP